MTYRHPNYNLREALTAGVSESYAEKILKKGVSRLQFDLTIMGKKCWIHFWPERYEHIILPEAGSEEAAVEILMKILDEYEDFDSRYEAMNGGLEDFLCRGWTRSLDDKRINRIKEIGINVKTNGKYWWVTAGKKICQICDNKDSALYHADTLKRELIMLSNDEVIKSDIKEELSFSGKLNEWQSVDEVMETIRPESFEAKREKGAKKWELDFRFYVELHPDYYTAMIDSVIAAAVIDNTEKNELLVNVWSEYLDEYFGDEDIPFHINMNAFFNNIKKEERLQMLNSTIKEENFYVVKTDTSKYMLLMKYDVTEENCEYIMFFGRYNIEADAMSDLEKCRKTITDYRLKLEKEVA